MLKQVNIHYVLNDHQPELIINSFYKLSQKFGHIHCFDGIHLIQKDLDTIHEMLVIAKKFNIKLTLIGALADWEYIFYEAHDRFLELVEHLDYIGIFYDSLTNPNQIEPLADLIWQFNGNLVLCTDSSQLTEDAVFTFPSTFDRWVIYTKGNNWSELPEKYERPKRIINDCPYFVDVKGTLQSYKGKTLGSIELSGRKLIRLLPDDGYKQRIQTKVTFPYKIQNKELHNTYYKIISGKAAFFDIEAVSRKLSNVAKHKHLNDFPIPILYSLIAIEQGLLMVKERNSYSVASADDLESIYFQFFKTIKRLDIQYLVVSGGALERRFLENMMYVLRERLTLQDVRYLFQLRDEMIDIQHLLQEPHNSDKLLLELQELYPDLITFERKSDKLSIKINFILDGLIFGPKRDLKTLDKIIHYCFEDVYADFELFKFYCLYGRYHLNKKR